MTRSRLKSVELPGKARSRVIEFALPGNDDKRGCVTVICGTNNSGKTYLLRRLRAYLDGVIDKGGLTTPDIQVVLTVPTERPRFFFSGKLWRDKSKVARVSAKGSKGTPGDVPDHEAATMRLVYRTLKRHVSDLPEETVWMRDRDARKAIAQQLAGGAETLYRCARGSAETVLEDFERIANGRVYVRCDASGLMEFALLRGERDVAPFEQWSEGQQAMFALMTTIADTAPDIVLLDEVENHLHPEYISHFMHWIKGRVPQTIVVTHHPHLIFSEHVEQVVYLEIVRPPLPESDVPKLPYAKHDHPKSLPWSATTLRADFERVATAYRLFDRQDNQLMRQAAAIEQAADIQFFSAVAVAFEADIASAKDRALPDGQTMQVVEWLRSERVRAERSDGPRVVVDLGAGLGRVASELSKLTAWQRGGALKWRCWEPDPAVRARLRADVSRLSHVQVLDELEPVTGAATVDLCVIANVLHELAPGACARLLGDAWKLLTSGGELLVLELYPLLHAEKYAVPYSEAAMCGLLDALGFAARSRSFPVHGATAYCVAARPRDPARAWVDADAVRAIDQTWDHALRLALSSYDSLGAVHSSADYRAVLQDLTTITSINAYRCGYWG